MKFSIILLVLVSLPGFASTEVWKLGTHFYEFNRNDQTGVLFSKSCLKKCEALKFLKKVSLKGLSPEKLSGGKNPGAVLCHENKSSEVVFLKDMQGNDNSFCQFKDKSFVSSSSLEIIARQNDEKK